VKRNTLNFALFLIVAISATSIMRADISLNPYILNPGFETVTSPLFNCGTANGTAGLYCNAAVADWSMGGSGVSGSSGTIQLSPVGSTGTDQSSAAYGQTSLLAATGNNASYINNLTQVGTGYVDINQTLTGVTLAANTTYTLTYDVARRLDDVGGVFGLEVYAGHEYLLTGDTTTFTPGQWVTETLTFTTGSTAVANPTVYLINYGSDAASTSNYTTAQLEFDAAPEPAYLGALAVGFVGLAFAVSRRRSAKNLA